MIRDTAAWESEFVSRSDKTFISSSKNMFQENCIKINKKSFLLHP